MAISAVLLYLSDAVTRPVGCLQLAFALISAKGSARIVKEALSVRALTRGSAPSPRPELRYSGRVIRWVAERCRRQSPHTGEFVVSSR
jgi:hypothetical protein